MAGAGRFGSVIDWVVIGFGGDSGVELWLILAFLLVMVPHAIATVSLATAMLPRLSAYAADHDLSALGRGVGSTLRTAYALIHPDRRVEHRRLPYDHDASAAALRGRFDGPWVDTVARRIEQARFDPE